MIKTEHLPLKDLVISGLIIFVISTIIANLYNPLWGILYTFGNVLTLTFLSWLYRDSWSPSEQNKNRKIS